MTRNPIILDTDIGTNIDDAYALVLAAVSPEVDLRGVTTVGTGSDRRAELAREILGLLNRRDVPVYPGAERSLGGAPILNDIPENGTKSAANPFIVTGMAQKPRAKLVCVGPLTNVATALRELHASKRERLSILAVAGNLGPPKRDTNSSTDMTAAREILSHSARIRFLGLNVTGETSMTYEQLEMIELIRKPLPELIARLHRDYLSKVGQTSATLHDPVAVAAIAKPQLVRFRRAIASVDEEDHMLRIKPGLYGNCETASWLDRIGFQSFFWERILSAMDGRRIAG